MSCAHASNCRAGAAADALLLCLLCLLWWASTHYGSRLQRVALPGTVKAGSSAPPEGPAGEGYEALADAELAASGQSLPANEAALRLPLSPVLQLQRRPLVVEFRLLTLRLRSSGRVVLAGVSGALAGGKLTAIMGPSGAGKSSLLNALAGRAPYGVVSGAVLVDGRPARLQQFKRVLGFVPQDDSLLHGWLTVEETLQ